MWGDQGADYLKALPAVPGPWLLISTGGADGAYGVGVLSGWSQTGQRPNFSVVTGVSTGALIAPFAFLGSNYDASLQNDYTTITSADIFEVAGKPEAPLDTWPLKATISRRITAKLLDEIATEHEAGRRLFIATSNLDAERPIIWNMGAIAAYRNERALKLFRDIVLASASIPGVFPPVYIDVEANGKRFNEMHADGGLNGPFFVAPEDLLSRHTSHALPASELFIIVNSKLSPDFEVVERDQISILGRSISVILKSSARVTLASVYEFAQRQGIGFNASWVDSNFNMQAKTNFDQTYMKALFELGVAHGKSGIAFRKTPFGHPGRAEEAGGSATGLELRR